VNEAVDVVLGNVTATALRRVGPSPDVAAVQRLLTGSDDLDDDIVLAVLRADGRVERESGAAVVEVDGRDLAVAAGQSGPATHLGATQTGATYRVRVVPIGARPGAALLVARPMAGSRQILRVLAVALALFGLLAVVAAGIPGRRVARAGVAPVRGLTAAVEQRAARDDLRPVPVASDDEIGRLGVAFIHLLDTVQVSRTRQARFVADAGHELRTPLTSLRTNIELLTVDADRAILRPEDRLTIMRDVRAQLMEFSALVSDLIGLTREDRRRPTSPTST